MMRGQFILAGTMVAMLPLLLPVRAATPEQWSFQIAQRPEAQERQQRQEQKKQERQEQKKQQRQEQRQQGQPQRPEAQERQQRQEQKKQQRQEQRQQGQPQRPAAQPPRPAAQPQQPAVQPQRPAAQPQRPAVQPPRPAAQERRDQQQRPAAQERRQERREDAREPQQQQRQERREDAREPQQERREDVRERREDRRQDAREDRREDAQRARRLEDLRSQRRETQEGNRTVIREPGRTIIREGGRTIVHHNEVDRFRRFGGQGARVEQRGNETFTHIDRPGGVRIITVVDRNGRLIRRIRRDPNGREVVIIDNRRRPGMAPGFFVRLPPPVIRIPRERYIVDAESAPPALLYETLTAPPVENIERAYALDEIRYSAGLRDRMPRIDIDTITFQTGSWEVTPDQAARLEPIAQAIQKAIKQNPNEVFLIEGHTDAVGDPVDNLSLSDRRAESVAIVLTEQFGVPPENLTTQGYGEEELKVPSEAAERRNRRVTVRRVTPLLAGKGGPQSSPSGG
ncbi:MAG: OmpA family protein [Rhizobiales bacterium]|nr:OmpA family protein [Hyphomicrobiales bacterium]